MDDDRQHKILLAAERLVAHYGVAKTTISDIAREARIGVGTVYLEFTSKDAIVARLASERHERILNAMRDASQSQGSCHERFRAMMTARVRAFIEVADHGAHASDLIHCSCEAVQNEFEAFKAAQRQVIAEFLSGSSMSGDFAIHDPELAATAILRAYATFTPPLLYHQTFSNLFQELDLMHQLLLDGLSHR